MLETGLGMISKEIVSEMELQGWNLSVSTLSRLRTGDDTNIDVAGLPFYVIYKVFPTRSGIAVLCQQACWLVRRALHQKLAGDDLAKILEEVENRIYEAEDRYAGQKAADNEEDKFDLALDKASILDAMGQVAATKKQHAEALKKFLEAFNLLLPVVRRPGCNFGALVCAGRVLAAALNEAYDLDEITDAKRLIGIEPVGEDWHLQKVLKLYKPLDMPEMLLTAINFTGDDRMAANHADGFQLDGKPEQAARMIEAGLAHAGKAGKGVTLETWQPHGRDKPVINEDYMKPAVTEYRRRRKAEDERPGRGKSIPAVIVLVLALAALYAATFVKSAEARPGRVTVNEATIYLT
jgi:hypothetical protein